MAELTTIQAHTEKVPTGFLGSASRAMRMVEAIAAEIAATNIPVLIVGESGTGKQALARYIHEMSLQHANPLVQIACGVLSPETVASAIPTGHNASAVGTVIFDEVSDLDRESQRRLLHVLPDGDEASENRLSARIISTSSQDLEREVRAGRFRNDLYHRLNGVCLTIPPLRERREDVRPLLDLFLAKHAVRLGRPPVDISEAAIARLLDHAWTGNVRELENVAMKILAVGNEEIALSGLSRSSSERQPDPHVPSSSLKVASRAASRQAERELILKALSRTQWNRKRAAQELQISYKSLLYKLKQIGVPESESE